MIRDSSFTLLRDGIAVQQHIQMQVDTKNPFEASTYSNEPHSVFDAFSLSVIDIRKNDYLMDEDITHNDPVTGRPLYYHVVALAESFPDNHTECVIQESLRYAM